MVQKKNDWSTAYCAADPVDILAAKSVLFIASFALICDVSQTKAKNTDLFNLLNITQDTKIASLERNIRDLEDEIQTMKTNGFLHTDGRGEDFKQMEVYKNHSKFMKNKVDALRLRLEERESFLNKKIKQTQDLIEEKGTLNSEICDLKDMLEVKEKKINILQKKVENLQEQLKDKDKQLDSLGDRMTSLQADSSNTDTALITLEEALSEKIEEAEMYKNENKELKSQLASLQERLSEKEVGEQKITENWCSLFLPLKEPERPLTCNGKRN
ncbi:ERC 2 [Labeo rohita]|uniref:ERC 2 n=1 Tax=Labeo rohita TaxID=84645 RepID=A0A498MPZ8_LABRO|nr:ERC 2 [Labeo rohita]